MKTISRPICGALLGPFVLSVISVLSLNMPSFGEDDWAHQQAQAQREREEWQKQQEQAQRDREQADRDRQARDDWYKQQEQAQKERDDWYRQQAQTQKERDDWYAQQAQAQRDREQAERDQKERDEAYRQQAQAQKERAEWDKYQEQVSRDYHQSILDGIERVKQQRDEILSRAYGEPYGSFAGYPGGGSVPARSVASRAKTSLIRRVEIPQVQSEADAIPPQPAVAPQPAAPPQPLLILNPFAFQISHQNQDGARQPIMPARQEMVEVRPELCQVIVNPFVGLAK